MPHLARRVGLAACLALLAGCHSGPSPSPDAKPIYRQSPRELDRTIAAARQAQPALADRVVALARQNIGQPYELYLLGEAPFESIDAQPVFCLDRSDCVVFVEHTLAMSLSSDFPGFLKMLQRIRYRDGAIGVRTRNHYTEADWNPNNAWLARDVTLDLIGDRAGRFKQAVDRQKFFKTRYKIEVPTPVQRIEEAYVPYEQIDAVKSRLRSGDVVEFVKGTAAGSAWVHHMGIVAVRPDGAVHLIHSTEPSVREEPIETFIARATAKNDANDKAGTARHRGFKFLRLTDDPMAELAKIDGPAAPRVTWSDASVTWEAFVAEAMKNDAPKRGPVQGKDASGG